MANTDLTYTLDIEPDSLWVTSTPSPATRSAFVYVQEAGDFRAGARYNTRRSGLDSYLFHLTLEGAGLLEYESGTYRLLPGTVFWIDCRKRQYYRTDPSVGRWHGLWVHCSGPVSAGFYRQFRNLSPGSCCVTLEAGSSVEMLLTQLIRCCGAGQPDPRREIQAAGLLTQAMLQAMQPALGCRQGSTVPEAVALARSYLSRHFRERITLDDLAARFSLNKYYLQKLFKRYVGSTPNEFLILTRINHAKEQLRATTRTVSEIAQWVGVENPSHFINLFKKHEGVTPQIYRRQWQESGFASFSLPEEGIRPPGPNE